MLKIRWAQLQGMSPEWRSALEERLVQRVEERYPEKVWDVPEAALRQEMTEMVDRCMAWGLTSPAEITSFVDIVYDRRREIDLSEPSITSVLGHPQLGPATKLRLLAQRLSEGRRAGPKPER